MPATPELVVVIGAGSIAQAIARRIGVGKTIMLADLNEKAAATAADTLQGAGFTTTTATVDVASHESVHDLAATASDLGAVTDVVHTAGLSPAQASPEAIIAVDLSAWHWCWRSSASHRGRRVRRRHRQPSRPHDPVAATRAAPGAGHNTG
jgi:threonine dehydrogenase-like Zn-dependent dehydrogenase